MQAVQGGAGMTLTERIAAARQWCGCGRPSYQHTHCPTCGSASVLHNRADCAARPQWVQRMAQNARDLTEGRP